jgi:hypothetical protein
MYGLGGLFALAVVGKITTGRPSLWKRFIDRYRRLRGHETPEDPTLWHDWMPYLSVRLIDGRMSAGNIVLRRKNASGQWEYQAYADEANRIHGDW